MRLHRDQAGMTIVELLVAMVLMLIVLTATLTSFDTFNTARARNARVNDAQDLARITMDRLAVQLRNLANPTNTNNNTIDTAGKYRLVFQTTDPSKRWVSYCLATSGNGNGIVTISPNASSEDSALYVQTATVASITAAMRGNASDDCPATGWATTQVQARNVVNRRVVGGTALDRPIFTYNTCTDGASTCLSRITDVNATLWIDTDTTRVPAEVPISTGVFLRNQNQTPTASFSATQSSQNLRTWLLNGTLSNDPEGRTLAIQWYKGPANSTVATLPDCIATTTNSAGTCIGSGNNPLLNYTFPAGDGTSTVLYLKVSDPGGLADLCSRTLTLNATASPVSCP